jgi:2-dehydro-3-deoxy-L-rhamnonate dehydrogenase (NAD+)
VNALDLRGRTAVVTGGAQGFGYAVAERLLASGAAGVSLWDIDEGRLAAAARALAAGVAAGTVLDTRTVDVADFAVVAAAADAAGAALGGRIDVLVNNAGITGPNAPTWEYPLDAWRRVLAIDLDGVFHCCRAVVPWMLRTGYGRIVNVASLAGKEGTPNAPAYSAAKAGVIALTKSLGKELATTGIRVNCVAPAAVPTAIFGQMSEQHIQTMLAKSPMGRFGEVREIAALVAWLASEEGCSFATGAVFDASGGRATY